MKTYSAKPGEINHDWFVVDAAGQDPGRLASKSPTACAASTSPNIPLTSIPAITSS